MRNTADMEAINTSTIGHKAQRRVRRRAWLWSLHPGYLGNYGYGGNEMQTDRMVLEGLW